jgi:chromosome segregation protein
MKFNKLRIVGFKSFVEPTEFEFRPGLTGVVGPNGCGKSNLVEALRWVMGENSYKNMRASGMDDVIFSGSGNRPARNVAEVGLVIDNADRTAPAAFNDAEMLEITRRIEREEGSVYRINHKEVRARDVQILFADASTGSRSPSMVRQGMIGEIISAKPQARRRILEEAAGVAGLHSRRHEAELRLKGADENLTRLEDVLKQVESQIDSLKRQSRAATRYTTLSADIRRNEALGALVAHRDGQKALADSEHAFEAATRDVAERTTGQAEAAKFQAIAAYALPGLRDEEARAGAALQRIVSARDALEAEQRRAEARAAELARRIEQIVGDLARQSHLISDANEVIARLEAEDAGLAEDAAQDEEKRALAQARAVSAADALAATEKVLSEAQAIVAEANAKRAALDAALRDETQRLARFEAELTRTETEFALLARGSEGDTPLAKLAADLEARLRDSAEAHEATLAAEAAYAQARAAEQALRTPLAEAEKQAQRLETEARTLSKLLASNSGGLWPSVVESIRVEKGYEAALGAALGDDLDASIETSAPAHWARMDASGDPALPPDVSALATLVDAPPALARRLAQIGIVLREEGPRLRNLLKPGQRLVSREGDLWRWDGFTQAAEAPTPAARRLAEKNRLGDLEEEGRAARARANSLRTEAEAGQAALAAATAAETQARQVERQAQRITDEARERHATSEKRQAQIATRLAALEEGKARSLADRDEAVTRRDFARRNLDGLDEPASLAGALDHARLRAAEDRGAAAEARAAFDAMVREAAQRAKRRGEIERERRSWIERREKAADHVADFETRRAEAETEARVLAEAPDEFRIKRRAVIAELEQAEEARKIAADARAAGESALVEADRAARAALDAMSGAREAAARAEGRLEAARQRLADILAAIQHDLECEPDALYALAEAKPGATLPEAADITRKLDQLKADRERIGPVNLLAAEELATAEASHTKMVTERDDLTEAIRKLRTGISSLNREGRERLLAAFDVVNGHFKDLFTTLFGGGAAELQLVESDDPLEAGLEILARPPGKKPQTMTLLSGGEQALTALSLIFAVFLTNPSPICVLDEVDAPLDDSNVERFCDLLAEMCKRTDTRFVTITHNPITMARMDRLFGVTMAERGVSQLVSVDLAEAERFLEAG